MRKKPLDHEVITTIQRIQIFSVALVERLIIQQLQEKGCHLETPGTIVFHEPQDQHVLDYMVQFSKVIPSHLQGSRFPGVLLLILWLAECRASELGYLLEGEVGLPYPTPDKQQVFKAVYPRGLYPTSCLSCGGLLKGENTQMFCNSSCRSSWSTVKEQFARISVLAASGQSVIDEYGTMLNAYSLFIHNPNYKGYEVRNPGIQSGLGTLLEQGKITLYRNSEGEPVDLQGKSLPKAELITDIEDVLA